MPKRQLLRYWPREEDVAACIKTDAEASSEAVSLAVHQPMRFDRRVVGAEADVVAQCGEHELLRAFVSENLSEGRVIVPIVGSSGIGKSHVIRWLDAQIRRLPGAERRVVIRIPKGTSLKGVLSILLERVRGPAYDDYRRELVRAQQELDPREASGLLCEMLAHTLGEMGAEARTRLLANPTDKDAQERDAYCRADMLPALLRNQQLRDQHFVRTAAGDDGVVKRLVEQLTEGRAAGSDDDRQHLFTPDDLMFGHGVDREALGRAETRALGHLEREDRRLAAVRTLNAALDDAKQRLLRLDPTVSDLFDAVRRELLRDGKELVLLVEDFAVLSGLQKQLLQVIIKEAIRDGGQVLCTMRTALAYTTGYPVPETVLTRAGAEYRIPDEPGSEAEILGRIRRLVGAYLNAARCGQSKLEQAYGALSGSDAAEDWVPAFTASVEPEARAALQAFGSSRDGYELFPFNAHAIDELAREGCAQANRLVYNPRFVIQNVINKVLLHRELFASDGFPPASFGATGRRLHARVAEEIKRRVPPAELDRYLRFLVYWGGYPGATADIMQVEPRVFSAFGLDKSLFGHATVPPQSTPNQPVPDRDVPPPTQQASARGRAKDPREAKWEERLEQWRAGIQLPQAEANHLRKWITEALKDYIDWDWELFRPLARDLATWIQWFRSYVYLPNAAGHEDRAASQAMVVVCDDSDLADEAKSARVHVALMALIRFHDIHRGSWDYEGSEDDLPRYSALLERLAVQARAFIRARYFRADWDPTPAMLQGLLIGARALGIEGASKEDHAALIQALFAAAPEVPSHNGAPNDPGATEWLAFMDGLRKCRGTREKESRDQLSWTGHLLNLVGARQGQADTVHAIDLVRLKPALEEAIKTWELTSNPPNPSGVVEFAPFRTTYTELKKLSGATAKAQRRLFHWRSGVLEWLGDGANKDLLVREFKETVEAAKAAGLTRGVETKRLLQVIEEFRNAKVMAALEDAAKLGDDAPRGTVLAILGRGYEPVARICEMLRTRYDEFMASVEAELKSEAMKYGDDPVAEAKATVLSAVNELETLLKELRE